MKKNILEFFYDHVDEEDWLYGLDIYTSARVESLKSMHGLVTAKVSSGGPRGEEARLKIHPNGHCIQWIECTCRKNRAKGVYCEHLAAFMICIDREKPELLANLDTKMPLKQPISPKKKRPQPGDEDSPKRDKSDGAAQTILTHLKGSIQYVRLMANGPTMKVRLEIKAGEHTNYHLQLDDAAKFLQTHPKLPMADEEVKKLKIHMQTVLRGTRIYQESEEKLVAERVVAIPHTTTQFAKLRDAHQDGPSQFPEPHRLITRSEEGSGTETNLEFVPYKSAQKFIGREYFFLPERGYWPISSSDVIEGWTDLPVRKVFNEDASAYLIQDGFQEYRSQGPIFLDKSLKSAMIENAPKLSEIHIHKSEDGWFYLDPRYESADSTISMLDLVSQFKKKKRNYIKQGEKWVKIPDFVKEHNWQTDESGQYLKVNAMGLLRLKAAVGDFDQFVGSKKLLNQIRSKLEFSEHTKVPSLAHTSLKLREYQFHGVQWMWWLYENQLHGLLADEMGLGKTHQAMALLSAIQVKKPNAKFIAIAPTTVLDHWEDKVTVFCPNLKILKHHGPKRSQNIRKMMEDHDLMITSYGVMLRDIQQLSHMHWDSVILDEAHFVKNQDTATYQAVCLLQADIRLCLTGTPIENHLGEMKNLFDFLVPGFLGSDEYFRKNFINPIGKGSEPEVELALQKLIHPFKMRRTKALVLDDLPEKVEDIRHCSLSAHQVKLYKDVLDLKAKPLVENLKNSESPVPFLHIFAILTMLKQICNHPALVNGGDPKKWESGKFEALKAILAEALESGHKVVIYSQYVGMIQIISNYLKVEAINHEVLTGQTKNRGRVIDRFQTDPECKIFIASLLAGGVGIDLTAASVVIHYDRWWNASKENQATDRVYRIGQNKNVQVFKMVTRGTLEEKIDLLINSKKELFEKFMDRDEEVFKAFSRSQLIELLQ